MAECENKQECGTLAHIPPVEESCESATYFCDDVLLTHIKRQSIIVKDSLQERSTLPLDVGELSMAIEKALFSPRVPPKRQPNGTCEANPRLNFYPTFVVPETLATYHIFFFNHRIPQSCRANRTKADRLFALKSGASYPEYLPMSEVPKIFEGLGDEIIAEHSVEEHEKDDLLVELKGDNPRLAVVKRFSKLTHFAYPAINLPPKVMECVMGSLIMKRASPSSTVEDVDESGGKPVVTDEELMNWLEFPKDASIEEKQKVIESRRKDMMAVVLVTTLMECMHKFFSDHTVIRKFGESIHYAFHHGYIGLASKIANIDLSNLISYMGILHENRLGQSVLHSTLEGEAKRDYIRDTIFLMLIHAWQTAMGVWQQCLEDSNVKELDKILSKKKKSLWGGFTELTIAKELSSIVMPEKLLQTLKNGLPDLVSQSMMQNFRSLILERSGILPAVSNALPSDFVPLTYKECPPPLWPYVYLLKVANYMMYHTDVSVDVKGEGLMEHYCRCNLCTPHRCLATNTALLNETQLINSFEIQGPSGDDKEAKSLKLTAGLWTSAFLRKFVPTDYHAHKILFYEDQSKEPSEVPTPCVITQSSILGQLQEIKKSREEFLLKKGHGVYLDPHTGEQLNKTPHDSVQSEAKFDQNGDRANKQRERSGGNGNRKRVQRRGGRGGRPRSADAVDRSQVF